MKLLGADSTLRVGVMVGLLAILGACESSMPRSSEIEFVNRVRSQAIQFEGDGDLIRALYQWQVIAGLQPGNSEAHKEKQRLEQAIESRLAILTTKFSKARSGNDSTEQRQLALKILALNGNHVQAREHLMLQGHDFAMQVQSRKDLDALKLQAERLVKKNADRLAHDQKMQIEKQQQERVDEKLAAQQRAKIVQADEFYRAGLKIRSRDLDQAIILWRRSLDVIPDNDLVQVQLERALKMQATLRKIEQREK